MQTMHRPAPNEQKGMEYLPCISEIKEMSETRYQLGGI
jgi:hypothetical protein